MRRLFSVVCATGLLVTGVASLASASETVWNFRFEGTTVSTGITGRGSTAYAASSTVAGVIDDPTTKDSKDTGTPPAAIYPVVISAWYRPTWGFSSFPRGQEESSLHLENNTPIVISFREQRFPKHPKSQVSLHSQRTS
ncbi:MAG: hypothetical protein WCL39_13050 [Armatimonadota bacterium]